MKKCEIAITIPAAAAAAAKSLQLCPILCDSRDGSPPGSPVPGILQARTLERVAIAFSNTWKWKVKVKSLSRVRLLATPWTAVGNTEKVNNDTVPFSTWSPQCLNGFRCDLGKSCSYAEWCRNPPCVLCTVAIRVTLALPRWDGCVLRAHLYLLLSRINLRRPYFQSCWSWPCWLKIWNWTSWTSSGTV